MNDVEVRMVAIFRDLFHSDSIELGSDFYDLGGDSTLAVTLGLILEDEFRLEIPLDLLEEVTTVQGIAAWIAKARQGEQTA